MKKYVPVNTLLFALLLAVGFALNPFKASAQPTYGNEWIVPSQTYYKISTTKNGIHRLTYDWLKDNIPGITAVNPHDLKLYRRGAQQSIFVEGEADNTLDPGDYVEFYGQRNDGKLDVNFYKDPANHKNPFFSMFTDTAAYFLTWSSAPSNRMQVNGGNPSGLTPEPFNNAITTPFQTREIGSGAPWSNMPWPHHYQRGQFYGGGINQQAYGDQAENWAFRNVSPGASANNRSWRIDTLVSVPQGADTIGLPKPRVKLVISGNSQVTHYTDIRIGRTETTTRNLATNISFGPYEVIEVEYQINFSDIAAPTSTAFARTVLKLQPAPSGGTINNTIRLVYATLTYPQTFNLAQKPRMIFPDPAAPVSLFRVSNAPANAVAYDLTDLTAIVKIPGTDNGAQKDFVFTNTHGAGSRPLMWIASASLFHTPVAVQPAAFGNITDADRDYAIITHRTLMQPAAGSTNPIDDILQYRSSIAGGGYKPVIAEMDQIYDQFHYGERSSYAIRNYINYMHANAALKFVFLVGKGLQMGLDNCPVPNGVAIRFNPNQCPVKDRVPTFGFPASDLAYVMDFRNNDYNIKVPIGRLSVQTPQQVVDYMNKVTTHEALPEDLFWRKNILHLVGGKTASEMQGLLNLMNQYKAIAEGLMLGGNVITRTKTSFIDPVQVVNVSQEINQGVSLVSFFGHASNVITDLDIGYVSDPTKNFNNINKYPAFIMAGCATGNAYNSTVSFGEDWIQTKEKGAVSFIAHVTEGQIGDFDKYMSSFYRAAYQDSTYGHPIGQVQQQTLARVMQMGPPTFTQVAMLMQMNLQGDPAVPLYGPQKPDYDITHAPVQLTNPNGGVITAEAPQLQLTIPVRNLGKAQPDSISISVKRTFQDASFTIDTFNIPTVYYDTTVTYTFEGGGQVAFGLNTFEIFIDNLQQYDELNEFNNKVTFEYFVPLSGVAALFPYNFSIVPTQTVTLKGQAFNILTVNQRYIFEIDTTHTFDSPLLGNSYHQVSPVITADLLPTWTVNLPAPTPANDSVVFFWRVRYYDILPGESPLWSTSSFTLIPGSHTGWSQSHIGQFNQDIKDGLEQDSVTRRWKFEETSLHLDLKTGGSALQWFHPPFGILTNGQEHFNATGTNLSCWQGGNRFLVLVLHPRTLTPVTDLDPSRLCGVEQLFYTFSDLDSASTQNALANFIGSVPTGYYVALISLRSVKYGNFNTSLRTAFQTLGSTLITPTATPMANGAPYMLVAKKGDPTFAVQEQTADPASTTPVTGQSIDMAVTLTGARIPGKLTSTIIGPAYSWNTLFYNFEEIQGTDQVTLKVIARTLAGVDSVFYPQVTSSNFSLSAINTNEFPYLKLELTLSDTLNISPAQLMRWLVTYTPAPEGIVRPDLVAAGSYTLGTFEAGQPVAFTFKFQNISDVAFRDTVYARVTLTSSNSPGNPVETLVPFWKLQPDSMITYTRTFDTFGLGEQNKVRIFFNPRMQPEQYYTNNILEATFGVRNDNLNPLIDVVFDGVHIMDGDLVNPDPVITISIKDENTLLFKDDTVGVAVYLRRGENGPLERISLHNNPDISITYATANRDFSIEYRPKNLPNGIYTLEVQGADKSGNLAGQQHYRIRFEIVRESTITQFYPYPNPFSHSCKFVFTLTGSRIPDQMKIQVITVTGKVVREITRDELGDIRIGVNGNRATDFSWDGTDEYGDKLANGVYLYRVVIGNKGDDFKQQNLDGAQFRAERAVSDKAFKKGYGKLYILR